MSFFRFILITILLLLVSCKVEPKKINYGVDHCTHCDMTVVDKAFACEYVTKKGRSYPFDAVECIVQKMNQENNEANLAFILVSDFQNPGNLIPASSATYLMTPKIKSPMGANLSAFKSLEKAQKVQQELGGDIYNWQQLKEKFKN